MGHFYGDKSKPAKIILQIAVNVNVALYLNFFYHP